MGRSRARLGCGLDVGRVGCLPRAGKEVSGVWSLGQIWVARTLLTGRARVPYVGSCPLPVVHPVAQPDADPTCPEARLTRALLLPR